MRIAICHHNDAYLNQTKKLLYCYAAKSNYEIYIESYKDETALLKSEKSYNLIFLSPKNSKDNHIDFINEIKKAQENSEIIFMSYSLDSIFEALRVRAFRFLLLPPNKDTFFEALNDFFNSFENENIIFLKSNGNTFCLNPKDILYLEADNKHCLVHLKDEIITINRTMAKIYEIMPKNTFCRVNKAFIINLRHIKKYNNEYIKLYNEENLRIGRTYLKSFKETINRLTISL